MTERTQKSWPWVVLIVLLVVFSIVRLRHAYGHHHHEGDCVSAEKLEVLADPVEVDHMENPNYERALRELVGELDEIGDVKRTPELWSALHEAKMELKRGGDGKP